jgi:hypothetical protein
VLFRVGVQRNIGDDGGAVRASFKDGMHALQRERMS